jgi:hypothetical protein
LERKRETLPHQSKEKPLERYADEGAAVSKRKKRVGKPGRRDPREEFGYGGVKKKKKPLRSTMRMRKSGKMKMLWAMLWCSAMLTNNTMDNAMDRSEVGLRDTLR